MNTDQPARAARLRREWLATAALSVVLLAVLVVGGFSQTLGNLLYDHLMRAHGFQAPQDIVVIAVDDPTLDALGGWPLKRRIYAELLRKLDDDRYRPKALGFDFLFLDTTPDDAALAAAMRPLNVVLPLEFKVPQDDSAAYRATPPVAPLADAGSLGHINLDFDPDGVIRGFETRQQQWPHFALALHTLSDGARPPQEDGYRRFRMVDPAVGFPTISLADALHHDALLTLLKDRYVLIGATAPSLGDQYPTLYSGRHHAGTPGVMILASILNDARGGRLIRVAPQGVVLLWSTVLLLILLRGLVTLRPAHTAALALLIVLGAIALSDALLVLENCWLDPTPVIPVAALLLPAWAWRRLQAIAHIVRDRAADVLHIGRARPRVDDHGLQPNTAREVVLQHAALLDRAVAAAQSEFDLLSAIVNEIPDAVLIFNHRDQVLLHNRCLATLVDVRHLAVGTSLNEVAQGLGLPPQTLDGDTANVRPNKAPPVLRLHTPFGLREVCISSTRVQTPQVLRLVVLTDVTELRASQRQRDQALQFLSHDMRTPLASILALTQLHAPAQDDSLLARDKIVAHAQALLRMMDDFILTIAAQAPYYALRETLLDNLLHDALAQVADLADARNVTLQFDDTPAPCFVMADARLMVRVFVNLLHNAVKFSPAQGQVHVTVDHPDETRVNILVHNTVDAHEAALGTSAVDASVIPGFGLGLGFVEQVMARHDGQVARQISAHEATVRITLPRVHA